MSAAASHAPPAAADPSAAASPCASAAPSFASISYGSLGHLVAHCLSLPDLAAWSATNKDGARVVSAKFDHYRFLNLSAMDNDMTVETFTALTDRLRGVEVVLLPYEHEFFLALAPAGPESQSPAMGWVLRGGINVLMAFLDANAAWLRIVAFDESQPLDQRPDGNCVSREQQRGMQRWVDMIYEASARWPHIQILPHTTQWIGQDESQQRLGQTLHAARKAAAETAAKTTPEQQQQSAGDPSAPAAVAAVVPSPLLFAAVLLDPTCALLSVEAWPALEMLHLVLMEAPVPEGEARLDPLKVVHSMCAGFSNLLYLNLKLNCAFPAHSTLKLAHPLLLQLAISDSENCPPLRDLDLNCPSLISLSCIFPFEPAGEPISDPRYGVFTQYVPQSIIRCLLRSPRLRALDLNMEILNSVPDLTDTLTEEMKTEMDQRAADFGFDSLFVAPRSHGRIFIYLLSLLPCSQTLECLGEAPLSMWLEELLFLFPRLRSTGATHAVGMNVPPWVRPHARDDTISFEHVRHLRTQQKIREWDRMAISSRSNSKAEAFSKQLSATRTDDQLSPAFITLGTDNLHQFTDRRVLRMLEESGPAGMFQSLRIVCLSPPTVFDAVAIRTLVLHCRSLESLSITQMENVGDALFMDEHAWPADFQAKQLHTLRLKSCCDDGADVAPTEGDAQAGAPEDASARRRRCFFSNAVLPSLARLFPNLHHLSLLISQSTPMDADQHKQLSVMLWPPAALGKDASPEQRAAAAAAPVAWPHLRGLAVNLDSACATSMAMLRWAWSSRLVAAARTAGLSLPLKRGAWSATLHGVCVDFRSVLRNRFNMLWCLYNRSVHHRHVEAGVLLVQAGVESACIAQECACETHQQAAGGNQPAAAAQGQEQGGNEKQQEQGQEQEGDQQAEDGAVQPQPE